MNPLPDVSRLSIARLRTLCRVAEAGSIVDAARGEANAQSQFSRQIKELEEALGTPLTFRAGKGLQLTPAGKQLALLSQNFFKGVEGIAAAAAAQAEMLRVGAGESVLRWLILPKLREIQFAHPPLKLELASLSTAKAIEAIHDGSLDLAVVRSDAVDASLAAEKCGKFTYILVIPRRLLPQRSTAGIGLIGRVPFAILAGDGRFARGVMQIAAEAGLELDIHVRADNFSLLLDALDRVDLAAVFPSAAAASLSDERFAKINLPQLKLLNRDLVLICHPKAAELRPVLRRATKRFCNALSEPAA